MENNQTELKKILPKVKNSLEGFHSRLDMAENNTLR